MNSPFDTIQDIISAQGQIFSHCAKRYGIRLVFFVVAAVFLIFAAIALHGVLWGVFYSFCHVGMIGAAACVLGVDVLVAVLFLLLAVRAGRASLAERRARELRERKVQELRHSFALTTILSFASGPVGRFVGGQVWRIVRNVVSRPKK